MEAYYSAEQFIPETFMIPGIGSNSYLTSTPPLEEIKYMGSEGAPEFVFDQGVYYPAAGNYYGYYCTGFESPGEWDDHRRFFGVDGQDLHYSDLQSQSLPYAYYTPSYGYAESPYNPYNPYNPYIPVIGHDGSFVGTQPYLSNPSYQHPVSSPTYFPVVTPSSSDILPVSSSDPSLLGTGVSVVNRPNTAGISYGPSLAPANAAVTSQRVASGNSILEPSQSSAHQIQSTVKVVPVNQPLSRGGVTPGSISQVTQGTKHFSPGQKSLNVTVPGGNGFTSFGSHVRGWASFDKFRPRFQYNGALNDVIGSLDVLGEQNRGPRTNRSKGSWMAAIEVRAYTTRAGAVDAKGNIIIHADEYNRDDFQVDYPDAKFFVIKSYSEDDVHKSIKYNVWSSTPNGNKRLDSAYEEAQRISVRKQRKCPVFLFFSVNASGQFCGVAEMIGPVDFNKDMDFWQQDKWTGSFPIKWHIVKDVPNASFRHIILENNENKPVTNSRDTQEIAYLPGMNMLSIFKNSPLRTSILDDFMYYEERQKIMYEEKCKLLGRNDDTSVTLPASSQGPISSGEDLPNSGAAAVDGSLEQSPNANKEQSNATLDQLPKKPVIADQHVRDDGKQLNVKVDQADKADEGHANGIADQPSNSDGRRLDVKANPPSNDDVKQPVEAVKKPLVVDAKEGNELSKADRKQQEGLVDHRTKIGGSLTKPSDPKTSVKVGSSEKQVSQALDATNSCSVGKDARPDPVDVNGVRSIIKIASLSIDSKIPEVNCTVSEVGEDTSADVVTVGSMHIKVKKSGESSGILTVGSILIDPKR